MIAPYQPESGALAGALYLAPRARENWSSRPSLVTHPRTAVAMPITNTISRAFMTMPPLVGTLPRRLGDATHLIRGAA